MLGRNLQHPETQLPVLSSKPCHYLTVIDEPIDITIDELALGVGLGSSAAFTVALLRVLSDYTEQNLSDEDFMVLAHELEYLSWKSEWSRSLGYHS